jgi:hypothetical protein
VTQSAGDQQKIREEVIIVERYWLRSVGARGRRSNAAQRVSPLQVAFGKEQMEDCGWIGVLMLLFEAPAERFVEAGMA